MVLSAWARSLKLPRITVWNSAGRVVAVRRVLVSGAVPACAAGPEPGDEKPRRMPATRPTTAATAAIAGPGRGQRVSYMAKTLSCCWGGLKIGPHDPSSLRSSERRILPVRVLVVSGSGQGWGVEAPRLLSRLLVEFDHAFDHHLICSRPARWRAGADPAAAKQPDATVLGMVGEYLGRLAASD